MGGNDDIAPSQDTATHWGYIMGLTAANIALTRALIESNAVQAETVISGLMQMREALESVPEAVRWLDITVKQISGGGNDTDQVQ